MSVVILVIPWAGSVLLKYTFCSTASGGLIAAGVTFGTSFMPSTWAWRIPSIVQGVFSLLCIIIIPFIPESPRWLAWKGRKEACLLVLAQTHADGRLNTVGADGMDGTSGLEEVDDIVMLQYREIVDTMEFERSMGETLSFKEVVRTPNARKRVMLACSAALFSTIAG